MCSSAKRICLESSRQLRSQVIKIEKLSDDNLVKIFSYLSATDMKKAALVCEHWNDLIGSSAATMKKLKIVIDDSKFVERFSSTRQHQNVWITDLCTAMQVVGSFDLSNAKFFKFYEFKNVADSISRLLSLMPLLEELHVGYRHVFSTQGAKVNLPKLRKLIVKSNDAAVYDLITCDNLFELDHQPRRVEEDETNQNLLVNLLTRCKKLKTLRLGSQVLDKFLEASDPRGTGWQLSSMKLLLKTSPSGAFVRNLEDFLMSQAATLTMLQFQSYFGENINNVDVNFPKGFFGKLFSEAAKLKTFRNTCDTEFFDKHGESLRSLWALEQLEVNARVCNLDSIAAFNPKLTLLKVNSVKNSLDSGLKFNNLKHLGVAFLGGNDVGTWTSLIENCPRIEIFEFKHFSYHVGKDLEHYLDVIKALLHHPTIRHLKFHSDDVSQLEAVFMKIGKSYGNLARLTLHNESDQHKSIEYLLPEDPTLWSFGDQIKRFRRFISNSGKDESRAQPPPKSTKFQFF